MLVFPDDIHISLDCEDVIKGVKLKDDKLYLI